MPKTLGKYQQNFPTKYSDKDAQKLSDKDATKTFQQKCNESCKDAFKLSEEKNEM